MSAKRVLSVTFGGIVLAGLIFLGWIGFHAWKANRPMPLDKTKKGVEISTNKPVYTRGEEIKVTIKKEKDDKVYTGPDFHFYEGPNLVHESTGLTFYRLKNEAEPQSLKAMIEIFPNNKNEDERKKWEKITMPSCGCNPECVEGEVIRICPIHSLPELPSCKKVSEGMTTKKWGQQKCMEKEKQCNGENYLATVPSQVEAGTYKAKFCFAENKQLVWETESRCEPKQAAVGPGDKRPYCVEVKFKIQD